MSVSAALDVVIGLSFTYFVLAVLASGIQEVIAGIFKWRGTYLSRSIDVILDNDNSAVFSFASIRDWLVAHFTQRIGSTDGRTGAAAGTTEQQAVLAQVLAVHQHPLLRGTPTGLPYYIPARNFSLALLQCLRDGSNARLMQQADTTIRSLPDGDLKRILSAFALRANGDLDSFRAQVETWFDDAMDRVSGIYKRLSQYMMLCIGLIIAVAFNVDTFNVAKTLWTVPADRAAIVASAAGMAAGPNAPGWTPEKAVQELNTQPIPFGWNFDRASAVTTFMPYTIPGWLITALAVSLGAPFWFDLLQNLSNPRLAGPKPNRADDPDKPGGSTPQIATQPVETDTENGSAPA